MLTGGEDDAIAGLYGSQVVAPDGQAYVLGGVASDPVVGGGGEQRRAMAMVTDRHQTKITDGHVIRSPDGCRRVPDDPPGDDRAAGAALELRLDGHKRRRRSGRGRDEADRRGSEQRDGPAARPPGPAITGIKYFAQPADNGTKCELPSIGQDSG